jgi:hypothetical protein
MRDTPGNRVFVVLWLARNFSWRFLFSRALWRWARERPAPEPKADADA